MFDNLDDPKTQLLIQMGLGLLGGAPGQRKNFAADLSHAGLLGMQGYSSAKTQQARLAEEGQQKQLRQMQIDQMARASDQQRRIEDLAPRFMNPGVQPLTPNDDQGNPMPSSPAGPPDFHGYAQALSGINPQQGLAMQAQLAALNQKERVKVSPGETIGTYNNGKFSPDYSAPEKPHFVDAGDSVIPVDQTGRPVGPPIKKNMSPDARATDERARERFAFDKEQGGKPQVISGPDGQVFAVDPRAGTGAPVVGPDGNPLNKGEKPLTESQAKGSLYLGMMQSAEKSVKGVTNAGFDPSGLGNQTALALARGDLPWVPKPGQNMAAGGPAQKYMQGAYQWSEAMLRQTTGANAPEAEVVRNAKTYFPMPGDRPELVKQKNAQRAEVQKYMAIVAGHGADKVNSLNAPQGDPMGVRDKREDPLGIR